MVHPNSYSATTNPRTQPLAYLQTLATAQDALAPQYPLYQGTNRIGQCPHRCNVVIPHISIDQRHASIEISHGEHFIEDHQSSTGTFLGPGQLQLRPSPRLYQLLHQKFLRLGAVCFTYFIPDVSPETTQDTQPLGGQLVSPPRPEKSMFVETLCSQPSPGFDLPPTQLVAPYATFQTPSRCRLSELQASTHYDKVPTMFLDMSPRQPSTSPESDTQPVSRNTLSTATSATTDPSLPLPIAHINPHHDDDDLLEGSLTPPVSFVSLTTHALSPTQGNDDPTQPLSLSRDELPTMASSPEDSMPPTQLIAMPPVLTGSTPGAETDEDYDPTQLIANHSILSPTFSTHSAIRQNSPGHPEPRYLPSNHSSLSSPKPSQSTTTPSALPSDIETSSLSSLSSSDVDPDHGCAVCTSPQLEYHRSDSTIDNVNVGQTFQVNSFTPSVTRSKSPEEQVVGQSDHVLPKPSTPVTKRFRPTSRRQKRAWAKESDDEELISSSVGRSHYSTSAISRPLYASAPPKPGWAQSSQLSDSEVDDISEASPDNDHPLVPLGAVRSEPKKSTISCLSLRPAVRHRATAHRQHVSKTRGRSPRRPTLRRLASEEFHSTPTPSTRMSKATKKRRPPLPPLAHSKDKQVTPTPTGMNQTTLTSQRRITRAHSQRRTSGGNDRSYLTRSASVELGDQLSSPRTLPDNDLGQSLNTKQVVPGDSPNLMDQSSTTTRTITTQPSALAPLSTSKPVPVVMFTGISDTSELTEIVLRLGGKTTEKWQECTHLVTDQIRRTVKFICALASGRTLVKFNWLWASDQYDTFLDPARFELMSPEPAKEGPMALESSRPLFLGYRIYVTPRVRRPTRQDAHQIITAAGGEPLRSVPSRRMLCQQQEEEGKVHPPIVVVGCPEDLALCQRLHNLGCSVQTTEFLLTAILERHIDLHSHSLPLVDSSSPKTSINGPKDSTMNDSTE
ncbi:Mediator of DNA damage checkpoint protein 1 [Dispira parvispora]|uniref:Mediator of DNA damage checkpoint protein 1 n=1 Tax=Dispira parvispora TaxID=1520584 RepID=A0A9W8ATK1_9FUNG|nr:Mediator of DNA damage checkpoint protein 1 [Dispira parvispora]